MTRSLLKLMARGQRRDKSDSFRKATFARQLLPAAPSLGFGLPHFAPL
jgi:hypothetical protein